MSNRDHGSSGYRDRDSYRPGGYQQRPYSSPYRESSRGGYAGRGGYRGGHEGRGGYLSHDHDRGYDSPRGGYGSRGRYSASRGDFGGRSYDRDRDLYVRRESGGRERFEEQRFRGERGLEARPERGSRHESSPYPRTKSFEVPPKAPLQNVSPWVKFTGMDQGERIERVLGPKVRVKVEEIRKEHQGNYIKIKDSYRKIRELEKDTTVFGMQLSAFEANLNGLETFRTARMDFIEKITLLGD